MVRYAARLLGRREVSVGTSLLTFERSGLQFSAGQYIKLGVRGRDAREYSICSGEDDPFLEVLIREIQSGTVSRELHACAIGSVLSFKGPFGSFLMPSEPGKHPVLLIANGTGIAPYRSFLRTNSDLSCRLLHGIRTAADAPQLEEFAHVEMTTCISREDAGHYQGRVSDFLREHPVHPGTRCYVCGSCDMIYDVFAILTAQGIPREDVRVETYY